MIPWQLAEFVIFLYCLLFHLNFILFQVTFLMILVLIIILVSIRDLFPKIRNYSKLLTDMGKYVYLTRYKIFAHSFHVKDTPTKTKEELLTLEDNRLSILIISGLCPISCPACFLMMCICFRARCWCDDNWGNMYVFRLGLFLLITTGEFSYSLYHGAHSNDAHLESILVLYSSKNIEIS